EAVEAGAHRLVVDDDPVVTFDVQPVLPRVQERRVRDLEAVVTNVHVVLVRRRGDDAEERQVLVVAHDVRVAVLHHQALDRHVVRADRDPHPGGARVDDGAGRVGVALAGEGQVGDGDGEAARVGGRAAGPGGDLDRVAGNGDRQRGGDGRGGGAGDDEGVGRAGGRGRPHQRP